MTRAGLVQPFNRLEYYLQVCPDLRCFKHHSDLIRNLLVCERCIYFLNQVDHFCIGLFQFLFRALVYFGYNLLTACEFQ